MAAGTLPLAHRSKLPYRFNGTQAEIDAGLPLAEGERVLAEGSVRCRTGPVLERPGFLRVTNQRLAVGAHFALQPDRLLEIPAGALLESSHRGRWARLVYRTPGGDGAVELDAMGGGVLRRGYPPELPLIDILKAWQSTQVLPSSSS
jgi:hypothetical protein